VAGIIFVPAEKAQDVRWGEVPGISLAFLPPFFSVQSYGLYVADVRGGDSPSTRLCATSRNIL
jgi:hypothetical protein